MKSSNQLTGKTETNKCQFHCLANSSTLELEQNKYSRGQVQNEKCNNSKNIGKRNENQVVTEEEVCSCLSNDLVEVYYACDRIRSIAAQKIFCWILEYNVRLQRL